MRKVYVLLYIIVVLTILLSSSVFALSGNLSDKVMSKYTFGADSVPGGLVDDAEVDNLSGAGTVTIKAIYPTYAVSGDGSPSSLSTGADAGGIAMNGWQSADIKSIGWNWNYSETALGKNQGRGILFWENMRMTDHATGWSFYIVGSNCSTVTGLIPYEGDEQWHNWIITENNSFYRIYIDKVEVATRSCNVGMGAQDGLDATAFTLKVNGGSFLTGNIDDLTMWNDTLTTDERTNFYNFGDIVTPIGLSSSLTTTIFTPTNNTISNNQTQVFGYNYTVSIVNADNCSLWTNISGTWEVNATDLTPTNHTNSYFTENNIPEGSYDWNVECVVNSTLRGFGDNNFTLTIDLTNPLLDSTTFNNLSVLFNRNLTGDFNFSDENLVHSINISIIDSINIFLNESIDKQTFGVSINQNITFLSPGEYKLKVRWADGHTANELIDGGAYKPTNGLFNDYIEYSFEAPYKVGSIRINQKDGSIFDSWSTKELEDRYQFSFIPNTKASSYTFEVESDSRIYIVDAPNTEYKQWLIYEEHWLDFMPYTDVTFNQINDNKVEVTINGVDPNQDELIFTSIGDLNVVTLIYNFTVANVTETFSTPISQTITESTELFLDINGNHSITGSVLLQWNHTNHTATQLISNSTLRRFNVTITEFNNVTEFVLNTTSTSLNVPHRWWFNFSTTDNIDFTDIQNQSIQFAGIDNCTTFTTEAVNFTLKEDQNNSNINGTMDGYFEVAFSQGGAVKLFNLTWGKNLNFAVCISVATANFSIFAQFEYQDFNQIYNRATYYLTNASLNNETQFIDLFVSPGASLVTFTVLDQDDNEIEDVFIQILRYDFGTNSHTINQIIKTDEQGQAIGNIVLNTDWYKFFLFKDGVLIFSSEPIKLTTTARTFRVDLTTDQFATISNINDVVTGLIYTNSTRNFAYTWANPTGTSVTGCLRVTKRNISGNHLVNQTCTTSASATILINIGSVAAIEGNSYIGMGSLQINPSSWEEYLEISFEKGFEKWGRDGIFMVFMLKLAMALMGIWSPIVAILLMAAVDIFMFSTGLIGMQWSFMVTYIILGMIVIARINKK